MTLRAVTSICLLPVCTFCGSIALDGGELVKVRRCAACYMRCVRCKKPKMLAIDVYRGETECSECSSIKYGGGSL